ncbi:MAG: hypothetical protein BA870_01210 [Desulfuromonadales bacterium C00003094]|nr:MAG: hypothetical protein BA870_01210 [Desulfuromonadales bacterium C00003094]
MVAWVQHPGNREEQMKRPTARLIVLLLSMLLTTVGCQSTQPTTKQLLQEDYLQMMDTELLIYYQQLVEGIEEPSSGGGGFGFGLGIGIGVGSSSAVGLGASKGPEREYTTEALQQRRNQVRLELSRRGLEPTTSY